MNTKRYPVDYSTAAIISSLRCYHTKRKNTYYIRAAVQYNNNCQLICTTGDVIYSVNVFHLTCIVSLHYLVNLEMLTAHVLQLSC